MEVGDVVTVRTDSKNRGKWPLAIVQQTYLGRNGHSKGVLERPVQHLYPLELQCDFTGHVSAGADQQLNPDAQTFRPRRATATATAEKIKDVAENEEMEEL